MKYRQAFRIKKTNSPMRHFGDELAFRKVCLLNFEIFELISSKNGEKIKKK